MSSQQVSSVNQAENKPKPKGRKLQARSIERRNKILDAAHELLQTESIASLSLYDVAARAEIPPSSLYYFFPSVSALVEALAEEIFVAFEECVEAPIAADGIDTWEDLGELLEKRMQDYYRGNIIARKMLLGQQIDNEVELADREHDEDLGKKVEAIYKRFFYLPKLPEEYNVFAIAMQIADKVYAMSHQKEGNISDLYAREGWRAAQGYLSFYLPKLMQKREQL
ncbi:TetR/AcrR family transcriptional regulator [Aestuariirhabdus sp. Z084]|uniref:TetR/AcrR family transcriptional regulator n=1 Tax=Aestuariirhabdus haliotis TaxID=2918751 RepID=UPI00201B3FA0|nr:TetR/AcrR family transcriptional regulator [Aestuariirhabdus haliotis]MCL6417542.1 TetR/AcrR family transcriptional regulator [Aestuariirhabdus haliotis]MCL6421485.1 TetR/AcrR family transcriptional regulator [Aestuariirhabdus haliotis]